MPRLTPLCRPFSLVFLLFTVLPAMVTAPEAAGQDLSPRSGLVLPRLGTGGRAPFQIDALEARIVRDGSVTPREGDAVVLPDGRSVSWQPIEADEQGWFRSRALAGGTLALTIESPHERAMLLQVRGGVSTMRFNGEPRTGDPYDNGLVRVPVLMKQGANQLLIHASRGAVRVELTEPPAPVFIEARDLTLPHLIVGDPQQAWGTIMVVNATGDWLRSYAIRVSKGDSDGVRIAVPSIGPWSMRKVPIPLPSRAEGPGPSEFTVSLLHPDVLSEVTITVPHAMMHENHNRTFISEIDGSVQYYAVRPATPRGPDDPPPGLTLALHGASVEGAGMRDQYAARPWTMVVAPTNRRPFGFDWEDWGRLDALEVLADAQQRYATDRQRVWLTGHSMGGHGTWILGALYPDRFAAIGPSAGWISFWSYAGGAEYRDPTPVESLLRRAANASDTTQFMQNLKRLGVYVLHGDADDNVPVAQARTMAKHLAEFHRDFAYYEQPGAGHWWGAQCCDWPPMFEFFRTRSLPLSREVRSIEFITPNPAVSAQCHWARIEAQHRALEISRIELTVDPEQRVLRGTTRNVARLSIHHAPFTGTGPVTVELDGERLEAQRQVDGCLWLERTSGSWQAGAPPTGLAKTAAQSGPFKETFNHRFILVYGTQGTPEENAWAYAKARYDAETFWYRGNGSVQIVSDNEMNPSVTDSNFSIILYGNEDTNAMWSRQSIAWNLFHDSPVRVRRGSVTVGERTIEGDDLAVLVVRPRPGSDRAMIAGIGGTGIAGMRATTRLPYFVSGVAYPDWVVFDLSVYERGAKGVIGAGFFGHDWTLETGDAAWREGE